MTYSDFLFSNNFHYIWRIQKYILIQLKHSLNPFIINDCHAIKDFIDNLLYLIYRSPNSLKLI